MAKGEKDIFKIAVFSGAIPSSMFIEAFIEELAKHHKILLFGVVDQVTKYYSKNIKILKTPKTHWSNLIVSLYRTLFLILKRPNDLLLLFQEISRYNRLYDKWIWYSKFLPIILYRPDIFHMQWTRDLEFYTFLKTRFHIPIVVSFRGAHVNYSPIVEPYIADIYKKTFPKVDAFHAVSEAIVIEAQQYGEIKDITRIIHSPIRSLFFENYQRFKKREEPIFKIGSVGRFHWIKGMKYAFDSCIILKDAGFSFEYSCITTNSINEEQLFQIQQLGLNDHIKIKEALAQTDLIEEMKTFDLLLLTSLEEGIANVVLEAMALGIPVISTDCGGMCEVVKPRDTGWLVPVRDPQAIANAIIEVSETSESEMQRITQNAHNFVKTHFNSEDSIKQFLILYELVAST
ncbi:glycosyltransferase family 4 protein [Yeosuana sp. MJ-SS3]|uniref:Glycosyltransferase family 4 protein n=1 Tax=Gilvirhabdus luticola TaxID=3079858 RepID=A0ABU3U4Y5_9FLAO|nr:glycosyltransferase family 4 protein [Yeosuana sp. MJ-SS3]MDU8885467.1 glycosyltransferase family 4 protein [Yeosuana sp. MJ-SS3]